MDHPPTLENWLKGNMPMSEVGICLHKCTPDDWDELVAASFWWDEDGNYWHIDVLSDNTAVTWSKTG